MSNKIAIKFDGNSSGIYRPNHLACIQVELICEKVIESVKEFRIEVTGAEKTCWTDTSHLKSIVFEGSHTFFEDVDILLSGGEKRKLISIEAGTQTFRHTFRIPRDAPSSFEGVHGIIEYKIKAIVDVAISKDLVYEQKFYVYRFEDFGDDYGVLREMIEVKSDKSFGRLRRQHLKICMSSIRDGFCTGEEIPVKITVNNHTVESFPKSSLTLCRIEKSIGSDPYSSVNTVKVVLCRVKTNDIPALASKNFDEVLQIPKNSPTTNDHLCELFQITYQVIFSVIPRVDKMKKHRQTDDEADELPPVFEAKMPVYIGSIPVLTHSESDESFEIETSTPFEEEDYRE